MHGIAQQAANNPGGLAQVAFGRLMASGGLEMGASAAGTVASSAAIAAVFAAKGLSGNLDAAQTFGGMARELGLAGRAGALGQSGTWGGSTSNGDASRGMFQVNDRANARGGTHDLIDPIGYFKNQHSTHGFSPTESLANMSAYRQGTGLRDRGNAVDFGALAAAGISPGAVGQFRSLSQYGFAASGTDPTRFAGLAQRQGLEGPGVDRYLMAIKSGIEKMAMRGVRVDPESALGFLRGMEATPGLEGLGNRGVAAAESLREMGASLGDQVANQYKTHAQMLIDQKVMSEAAANGGTPLDIVRASRRYAGNESLGLGAIQGFGGSADDRTLLAASAMQSLTLDQASAISRPGAVFGKDGKFRGEGMDLSVKGSGDVRESRYGRDMDEWAQLPGMSALNKLDHTMTDVTTAKSLEGLSNAVSDFPAIFTGFIDALTGNTEELRKLNGDALKSQERADNQTQTMIDAMRDVYTAVTGLDH